MKHFLMLAFVFGPLGCFQGKSKCATCLNKLDHVDYDPAIKELEIKIDSFYDANRVRNIRNGLIEAYRISWNSSLAQGQRMLLVEKRDSGKFMVYQEFFLRSNWEGSKNDEMIRNEFEISDKEWWHIQYLICHFGFWSEKQIDSVESFDGYYFIIEGNCPNSIDDKEDMISRTTYRSSPAKGDNLRRLFNSERLIYEDLLPVEMSL